MASKKQNYKEVIISMIDEYMENFRDEQDCEDSLQCSETFSKST